jgi:hypothetical protein
MKQESSKYKNGVIMYINNGSLCKNISVLLILFLLLISTKTDAQKKPVLRFNSEGKFKIVQFTDSHIKVENKVRCDSVINTITSVIASEKPDLVVLTGDIATSEDVKAAWSAVTKPMRDAGIPWAAVFGNHDFEHGYTNKQMMAYLETLPYNLSQNGPKNIHGSGNYILEVKGKKGNTAEALLYFFDSNAYTGEEKNEELGHYDWIRFDQIKWYREESKKFTKKNNGNPYPALAFFHIPLPEYSVVQKFASTVGDRDEGVASPKINSGMYNAILESGDIMGTFCGHDHNNNFIGVLNKIALAYGCKTGRDVYGTLDKGGRVIVLYEGQRKFDTWIHNTGEAKKYPVTYPDSFVKAGGSK